MTTPTKFQPAVINGRLHEFNLVPGDEFIDWDLVIIHNPFKQKLLVRFDSFGSHSAHSPFRFCGTYPPASILYPGQVTIYKLSLAPDPCAPEDIGRVDTSNFDGCLRMVLDSEKEPLPNLYFFKNNQEVDERMSRANRMDWYFTQVTAGVVKGREETVINFRLEVLVSHHMS
jgi:hypothetical protein